MIDDGQLRIWAAEAKEARESALWEYCPKEFWLLLTEIARLKAVLEEQATELARRKEEWL